MGSSRPVCREAAIIFPEGKSKPRTSQEVMKAINRVNAFLGFGNTFSRESRATPARETIVTREKSMVRSCTVLNRLASKEPEAAVSKNMSR
jgi:hypothetical protein